MSSKKNMNESTPIISVTGTKGKTTTVAVIADILQKLDRNVLKVDTTGHFINSERRSTLDDSKAAWRLVPSVSPGRYLYEFLLHPRLKDNGVAVLECSLGCSAISGLGYRYHNVGVFLNVFEDHLGSSPRIQSKEDIMKAKAFIFSRLDVNSSATAVFNADDRLVCRALEALSPVVQDNVDILLPVGFTFTHFDIATHIARGGRAITVVGTNIVLRSKDGDQMLADLRNVPWTFNGEFLPSVWNMVSAVGAVYGFLQGELPDNFREIVESVRLDPYGGRLTLLRAKNGTTILADYAHEKESLAAVAGLGRTLLGQNGHLTGVVRMAHDRTDELKFETGAAVGRAFDNVVVYEKIDGYWRQPKEMQYGRFKQEVGATSEVVTKGAQSVNERVVRIMREDKALDYAAKQAGPDDVVVVIVNDDIKRSIGFIKDAFEAEFV